MGHIFNTSIRKRIKNKAKWFDNMILIRFFFFKLNLISTRQFLYFITHMVVFTALYLIVSGITYPFEVISIKNIMDLFKNSITEKKKI